MYIEKKSSFLIKIFVSFFRFIIILLLNRKYLMYGNKFWRCPLDPQHPPHLDTHLTLVIISRKKCPSVHLGFRRGAGALRDNFVDSYGLTEVSK